MILHSFLATLALITTDVFRFANALAAEVLRTMTL